MKGLLLKGISGTMAAGIVTVASLSSVFAATNVTRISTVDINNSYVGTLVSQSDSKIKASGDDVDITDISDKRIRNSIVDTAVFDNRSTITAKGRNVNVISADNLTVDNAYVDTLVNDTKSRIKAYSR